MNKNIKVAYLLNSQNWENCFVSMISLIKNTKNFLEIYLFEHFIDHNIVEKFLDYGRQHKSECLIKTIKFTEAQAKLLPLLGYHHNTSFCRILVPILCPEIDRIIILPGCANIITGDLSKLYNLNIPDNYIMGVTDDVVKYDTQTIVNNLQTQTYSNFNVMLLDCKKFREQNIFEKFNRFIKTNSNADNYTDIFNMVFDGLKFKIDLVYNYQELDNKIRISKKITKSEEFQRAQNSPLIIDYVHMSPQNVNFKSANKNIWWKYAQMAPFEVKEIHSYKLSSTTAQNSFKYSWLLSRIWPYIKPYWFRILLGFAIAIPLGLLDGVTAFALKPYMDYVIGGKAFNYSWHNFSISISSLQMAFLIPAGVVLFAALQGVLRYLNGYFSYWVSARITNDVKFDLFDRLIHMHPQFFDDNPSGIVISRYMGDPGTASAGIVDNIKTITTSLCGALGLIAVMIYSSWQLAFIGVLILCVAFVPVILIRNRIKEASNKGMVIGGNITTNINETYSGNKVMAAYGLQDRQNRYFRDQVWKAYDIGMSLYKRSGWMSPLMYLIASIGIAIVLGYGTYLINSGQMTAGSFASFVTSLLLLYKPVKTLGNTLTGIQNIFVAMGRVFELFDLTPAIEDCKNPKVLKGLNNSIDFENVYFEYVPNNPVLKNFNLHVNKNETLAIVGNSGGGKSTLVSLLPRFYDIKSGSIKFDGVDIREYSLKSLRENISMVFQDNFLFSGTIKENIMMGNPDATVEELMLAIKSAHLQDMISELPDGLDTMLGERGLTLSGGQRQRVAIARAMLRNAPIVILDEATSALDNESEAIVQKAMDNLMENRTVFIIAHRLSTIKNADRIAVINEGELVELGRHDELMQIQNGHYRTLYEMQFKKQPIAVS